MIIPFTTGFQIVGPSTNVAPVDAIPDIGNLLFLLAAMGIAPFVLAMATSFARLVIIGGLLRQALGLQQIPPTSVLTGIAFVLTIHIMSPVVEEAWMGWRDAENRDEKIEAVHDAARTFLEKRATPENVRLFQDLVQERQSANPTAAVPVDADVKRISETLTIYLPAFVLSELSSAFFAGFLLFIPFLVIDLIVSNILLALGMHMLSPTTVSLPIKILVFVLANGWTLVIEGVVRSYQVT